MTTRITPLAVIVACAGVGLGPAPAWAIRPGTSTQVGETANTTTSEGREVIKSVRGGYVHAISLLCTTAPCEVAIYDSTANGVANTGVGTLKWEGRVASNNGTYTQDFPVPLVTENGIAVEVAGVGGSSFVEFE